MTIPTLAIIGIIDSSYLTVNRIQSNSLQCLILKGCDTVTTSKYSEILGIPVAFLGVLYYILVIMFSVHLIYGKEKQNIYLLPITTLIGFIASLWFVFLQFFVIKAICTFCMISAGTSTLIFLISIILFIKNKKDEKRKKEESVKDSKRAKKTFS